MDLSEWSLDELYIYIHEAYKESYTLGCQVANEIRKRMYDQK